MDALRSRRLGDLNLTTRLDGVPKSCIRVKTEENYKILKYEKSNARDIINSKPEIIDII